MFSFAVVDGARRAYDAVGEIEVQMAVLDHLAQERSQVARIQLAGVNRDGGGQVQRGHDRHAIHVYGLAGFAQYAIASGRSREVYDDRPALHSGDGLFGDQQRGAAPGHGGGSDDAIGLFGLARDQLATAIPHLFGHLPGVTAGGPAGGGTGRGPRPAPPPYRPLEISRRASGRLRPPRRARRSPRRPRRAAEPSRWPAIRPPRRPAPGLSPAAPCPPPWSASGTFA